MEILWCARGQTRSAVCNASTLSVVLCDLCSVDFWWEENVELARTFSWYDQRFLKDKCPIFFFLKKKIFFVTYGG